MPFAPSDMKLSSSAFDGHGKIPKKHTQEGDNVSPALSWTSPPDGTKSFAVICHDPDAPLVKSGTYGFVHWVLYNLPGSTTQLEEGSTIGTVICLVPTSVPSRLLTDTISDGFRVKGISASTWFRPTAPPVPSELPLKRHEYTNCWGSRASPVKTKAVKRTVLPILGSAAPG